VKSAGSLLAASLLAAASLLSCAPPPAAPAPTPAAAPEATPLPEDLAVARSWRRVALDAGHGGDDHGAIGVSGSKEKDVVLAVARQTERALVELGFEVVQTRTDDRFLPLPRRAALANASGAGLFVSIHANAAEVAGARGVETYSMDRTADEAAMRLAERENRARAVAGGRTELDPLLEELRATGAAALSHQFAARVQSELIAGLRGFYGVERIADRGAKRAPFWVLLDTEVPSVLVELGYLTHADEEERLRTRGYQVEVARALAAGIAAFAADAEAAEGDPLAVAP